MSLENETFESNESAEPTSQHDRTSFGMLEKLSGKPFEQAARLVKYLGSVQAKKDKLIKLCSPAALKLARENNPEVF
jgi:hypothetical protein